MAEEVEETVEGKELTVDIESGGGDGDRTVEEVVEGKLRRHDSLLAQASKVSSNGGHKKDLGWTAVLQLAFQSLGIVYGDIGTSPLYVYASTFTDGIKHEDDILGVLSLIFYTITLITLIKYVFIVLRATDNGDGGGFALYSLICRYAKVSLMPSQQAEDGEVSNYRLDPPNNRLERRATKVKSELERRGFVKYLLLFVTMLGTSMVIGDGVLTPCISVLSAVGGIKEATNVMTEDKIVWISVAILILLFFVQRFGTNKVGYTFAPIILIWFLFIAVIGIINITKYDPKVLKAINPAYIVDYFARNKKQAWVSLGGVILCITGSEALFADVGHFTVRSVQISMCSVAFPSLILAYAGQASYLRHNMNDVSDTFYKSIPGGLYWPMFVVAVLAAIIASQAMISGTFSIIQQSLSLGCFPRVKIVHTSAKFAGQVYIPEVNYLLMLACVGVTVGFKTTQKIGNAYGIAVVFVMTLTSSLLVLIMIMIWKWHVVYVVTYSLIIGSIELVYLSSVLYKFDEGGYLPLAFAALLVATMLVWNYSYRKKYAYEYDHMVAPSRLTELVEGRGFARVPGMAFFYSELAHGVPPIFERYIESVPAVHSVLVFVSVKSLPISKVSPEERFLFRRVGARGTSVFRCVARYGYNDVTRRRGTEEEEEGFEKPWVSQSGS
ncbi:Potassium transporter 5 [Acorus gramineus]|uniref:Potassium transporter n=1 Tax=Acorus gramineus TaxID=55184 RepID=A0AAV9BUM2_ACOGR|nr:Potassium transporter 5 [Acorus gramineus]